MIVRKNNSISNGSVNAGQEIPTRRNNKVTAMKHIKAAIDLLGKDAKTDVLAKESIANLSVVLLDLKE